MTLWDVPRVCRAPLPALSPSFETVFKDGLRLATFRRMRHTGTIHGNTIALMVLLSFLVGIGAEIGVEWIENGGSTWTFQPEGLGTMAVLTTVGVGGAVVSGWTVRGAADGLAAMALSTPIMLLLLLPLFAIAIGTADAEDLMIVAMATFAVIALLLPYLWTPLLAFRRLTGRGWLRCLLGTFVFLAPSVVATLVLPDTAAIAFHGGLGEPVAEEESLDVERLYYRQPELVAAELDGLAPERPGRTDLFAVLLAGHPYERVFLREIEAIGPLLEDRFGASGRTVRLANSLRAPDLYPLANLPNLRAMLSGVAGRMNPDEDVLLLYLTSHGSPAVLDTSFWEVGSNDIDASELAWALHDSGIRQAVVIVSACRSGSFIPYLQQPTYVVMTAAAADRNSFGCSDRSEWTWFGQALFETGLSQSADLEAAFEAARREIERREADSDYDPSHPQIYLGEAARPFLDRLVAEAAR